jgi:hypothetical protein
VKLIPNPEYALAEMEQHYVTSPAAKPIKTEKLNRSTHGGMDQHISALNAIPRRWMVRDHAAVVKAMNANDWAEVDRLCVPSHIEVLDPTSCPPPQETPQNS